jgi:hypothetical protein
VEKATALAEEIEDEGAAGWKISTALDDLRFMVQQTPDPDVRSALEGICDRLARVR